MRLTGRTPVPTEVDERPQRTGLDRLHAAMRAGRLDGYRAGVVADELLEAPAPVADAVVAALEPRLDTEPAPALRRRTRRLLARISPDLLRQRAARARREDRPAPMGGRAGRRRLVRHLPLRGIGRRVGRGRPPRRRYVTEGSCSTIEQARARPSPIWSSSTPMFGCGSSSRRRPRCRCSRRRRISSVSRPNRPESAEEPIRPGPAAQPIRPGRVDDVLRADRRSCDARAGGVHFQDLVQVHGVRPSEPVLVPRGWLDGVAAEATDVVARTCHPGTGALVDEDDSLARDGYRPGRPAGRVREGPRRALPVSRLLGCGPVLRSGPREALARRPHRSRQLVCLCRRHHRVKQSPRMGGASCEPTGSPSGPTPPGPPAPDPLDALERVVLAAPAHEVTDVLAPTTARPRCPACSRSPSTTVSTSTTPCARHHRRSRSAAASTPRSPRGDHRRGTRAARAADPPF